MPSRAEKKDTDNEMTPGEKMCMGLEDESDDNVEVTQPRE